MNKLIKILKNPYKLLAYVITNVQPLCKCIPDDVYLKIKYRGVFGKKLNLKEPQTFNEKLQWLKLYDRRPEYTTMVDKYAVKKYVADRIGEEYIIPTLGVWDHFDDIDFSALPNQFVLKCTHDSGGLVICKDKNKLDIKAAKKKIESCLKKNFYYMGREWPYKNVKPRIIAEKYMVDESDYKLEDSEINAGLSDYKMMCFNGKVRCSFVCSERFTKGLKVTFYDNDWNFLPFERHYPKSDKPVANPKTFDNMVQLAEKLSKDIPFVRSDFYEIDGKLYFGELTFYPGSGFEDFTPDSVDYEIGQLIKLPDAIGGYWIETSEFCIWLHSEFIVNNDSNSCNEISAENHSGLIDYKFYCFNGEPLLAYVSDNLDNHEIARISYVTLDWKQEPFYREDYRAFEVLPSKPKRLSCMLELCRKLSNNMNFLRVDFYELSGQIYFGELTFFPGSGFTKILPEEWDYKLGEKIHIRWE